MNSVKRFFLSRVTILTLIVLALGALLVASAIPQAFLRSRADLEKWQVDYPTIAPLAESLGLSHVYTHPAFAIVLVLALISLLFSCMEQFKSSWRRTFDSIPCSTGDNEFIATVVEADVVRHISSYGYLRVGSGDVVRYLRHPWGQWGNFLLHAGMVVVIASSLWIALTQQRGMLHIAEGDIFRPGQRWVSTEKGLFAKEFALDESVRLDHIAYEFWPTYGVKTVASTITFLQKEMSVATRSVEINSISEYRDMRIYQGVNFGHAFFVEVKEPLGKKEVIQLLINHQVTPDTPSYNDFANLLGEGITLRAKYFVDEEKKSLIHENPLLVLRVDRGEEQLGQVPMKLGTAGAIGSYQFRLLRIAPWSSLIFVKLTGITGIFLGFFIICTGGMLNYFTPTREVFTKCLPSGEMLVSWRAMKFAEFYRDEFERLKLDLTGEKADE